jgi:hypothetical protein
LTAAKKPDRQVGEMRSFAWVVSGGFIVLFTLAPFVLRKTPRLWPLGLALVLLAVAYTAPLALRPLHKAWMATGHALGWVNSRIILSIVFYFIFFPIGFFRRMMGQGTIVRSLRPDAALPSYRVNREAPPAREQMEKPY